MRPCVYLCMPFGNGDVSFHSMMRYTYDAALMDYDVVRGGYGESLLAKTFNKLWYEAIDARSQGITHFAMLHSDVIPQAGWLDVLLGELIRLKADVVSAVIPVKNNTGITSTAIDDPDDEFWPLKRLTLKEVHKLPETFTAADSGYPNHRLLVNTGCWVADLSQGWCDDVCFTVKDKIVTVNGRRVPATSPEDWNFSRFVQDRGGSVYATRKVVVEHEGKIRFTNAAPWGTWDTDQETREHVDAGNGTVLA